MPRSKKYQLTPEETARIRQTLDAWLAGQGYDDVTFGRLLGVKPETVKVNLGRAAYKTQRPLSDTFLEKAQRVTGLPLGVQADAPRPVAHERPQSAAADQVVLFLARAVIATAGQLSLLANLNRTQFNRLAQTLLAQKLVEREREAAPPSGLARSRQYIYGLSALGRGRAQKLLATVPQSAFSRGRLRGNLFVSHDLRVSEAALRLCLSLPNQLADWYTGVDCRDAFQGPQGRAALEPDLLFQVNLAGGPGCGGRAAVADKVRAMEQYYRSGAFRRRWETERLTIFWIGETEDHAQQLRNWVGPCHPGLMHKFTSWDWVQRLGIAGPIWLRLNGGLNRFALLSLPDASSPALARQPLKPDPNQPNRNPPPIAQEP